ncbi:ABC transporter substrate-binding protein [Bailinhaonella thermotolerans]|uniref:ABC transporter substrate-binding protein n=2 Tax=Bailinhaonella thermotolerans TaxID=1070861 RepID=A0A3A4AZV3_9ACTN|nr:ABC transporter substrate-binding protein [Bailinhaonella thermotolerans]
MLGATAGCGAGAPGAEPTKKLRIAATGADSLPFMAILQVAIDKGWFEQQGLEVSIYSGSGGGSTLRVVATGDADMAITGNTSVVLAGQRAGSRIKVVAPWFQVNDFSWIGTKTVAKQRATLGFSSAGSTTELIVKALQRKMPGISSLGVGAEGDNWAAVKSGRIDAGWAMHPFITEKQDSDGAKTVVTARDEIGDFPADLVAVNSDYAERNRANLTGFFTVVDKMFGYVRDDPGKAAADIAPLLKVTPEIMKKALEDTPDLDKAYSLKVDPAALKNLSDLMVAAGQITKPIDWGTLLDQSYLPAGDRAKL